MARRRTPQNVADITGASIKNAGRYVGRSSPRVSGLGEPPARLSAAQKAVWRSFRADFPWLARSDRRLVELACVLKAIMDDPHTDTPLAAYREMRLLLTAMGGTPVDRSKVAMPDDGDEDEEDPAAEFLN